MQWLRKAGRFGLPGALLVIRLLGGHAGDAAWPQFRGPDGSGVAPDGRFPVQFGPDTNVVWRTAMAPGHSSPVIWGERLFLTAHAQGQLQTLGLDLATGATLWTRSLTPEQVEPGSHLSSPASSTPATDGRRIIVYFGSFGLLAYDLDGAELWRKPLPIPLTQHGTGTSPILVGDTVLLSCDQDQDSHLLAVDARSGATRWRADRPGFRRGFSTPAVWPPAAPELVLVAGTLQLVAYVLADGRERWRVGGLPNEMVASPVATPERVVVAGWTHGAGVSRLPPFAPLLEQGDRDGDGQLTRAEAPEGPARQHFFYMDANRDGRVSRAEYEAIARIFERSQNALLSVRPDGSGDVTETHVAWKRTRGLPYVPSPLVYEGRVFVVKNGGLASCFRADTGEVLYQEERLGALGDYYASPVAAAGRLCAVSINGVAVVLRSADTLEVLARNDLKEPVLASPAIAGARLYLRTKGHLYAFGEPTAVHPPP